VPLAVPVMRQVARMELPSTRAPMTLARRSADSRFILSIMHERSSIVKGNLNTNCYLNDVVVW
jgi:hypothetical protein